MRTALVSALISIGFSAHAHIAPIRVACHFAGETIVHIHDPAVRLLPLKSVTIIPGLGALGAVTIRALTTQPLPLRADLLRAEIYATMGGPVAQRLTFHDVEKVGHDWDDARMVAGRLQRLDRSVDVDMLLRDAAAHVSGILHAHEAAHRALVRALLMQKTLSHTEVLRAINPAN